MDNCRSLSSRLDTAQIKRKLQRKSGFTFKAENCLVAVSEGPSAFAGGMGAALPRHGEGRRSCPPAPGSGPWPLRGAGLRLSSLQNLHVGLGWPHARRWHSGLCLEAVFPWQELCCIWDLGGSGWRVRDKPSLPWLLEPPGDRRLPVPEASLVKGAGGLERGPGRTPPPAPSPGLPRRGQHGVPCLPQALHGWTNRAFSSPPAQARGPGRASWPLLALLCSHIRLCSRGF